MKKIFFEDKLSGDRQAFSLFHEKDLPFLKHRVLVPQSKKTLVRFFNFLTNFIYREMRMIMRLTLESFSRPKPFSKAHSKKLSMSTWKSPRKMIHHLMNVKMATMTAALNKTSETN
jgi:hypothetical protein